ncbi:MAG: 3-dehydroquinate synthase [Odoribacteraceae bacterium]|nr:3-dehydroquinate synthase [Odoribacteraceae bacterium]
MEAITLHGSQILVGESAGICSRYLPAARVIVITNPVVRSLHGGMFPTGDIIEIGDGEEYKTLETIDFITEKLIALEADRDTFLLGIGGGIVCDITGFMASIFMRGCAFGFIPTTLLAQVDASVGGKNGVNFRRYKNMLGLFAQPRVVLCDPALLYTLPSRVYAAGFAEVVKAAMIASASLFGDLEGALERIVRREETFLAHVVWEAIQIKAAIVARDERERGERRLLNLGHTFAHAIEKSSCLSHGEAVSVGLCMASRLSVRLGLMSEAERERVTNLLASLDLPVKVDIPCSALLSIMRADKKKSGDSIYLILPVGIGRCEMRLITFADLRQLLVSNDEP